MIFESFAKNQLQVLPDLGIGYYSTQNAPLLSSKVTDELTATRISLVDKFTSLDVLDIGSKGFVKNRNLTKGFSTDQDLTKWLVDNKLYRHPLKGATALTFWNTFDLICDHRLYLSGADEYVFISTQIYEEVFEINKVQGKYWYFTINGLVNFMKPFGFEIQEINWIEKLHYNGNIATFVFKRSEDLE